MTSGAEPERTSYVGELEGGGVLLSSGGEARRVSSEVRWTITVAVASYQADLRSRVSGKNPLAY